MITNVTEDNFQQEVEGHAGRVLIDFYTPTCPPCRAFAPTLEQTGKMVKIDASVEGQLAAEFDITAVPTFVLLDSGEKKAQLTGARSKKDFEKWLDEN
jgi:thioredoxin-like negative regulator of GroEL